MDEEDKEFVCVICKVEKSDFWWKCCPKHTTQCGSDVVCNSCKEKLHPGTDPIHRNVFETNEN